MQWIIAESVLHEGAVGIAWSKQLLAQHDTSRLQWVRINRGREHRRGAYGRCWSPGGLDWGFGISCQVPGPFPRRIEIRQSPLFAPAGSPFPSCPPNWRQVGIHVDARTGNRWMKVTGTTIVRNINEAIVWIMAHEIFHFLWGTRQVPGPGTEIAADHFADAHFHEFVQGRLL